MVGAAPAVASSAGLLRKLYLEAGARARRLGRPVLAACAVPVAAPLPGPADVYRRARRLAAEAALWLPPGGPALVAAGEAWAHAVAGPEPGREALARAGEAWRALSGAAVTAGQGGPLALVAAAFDPGRPPGAPWLGLPRVVLSVPRVAVAWDAAGTRLLLAALARPEGAPDDAAVTSSLARRLLAEGVPPASPAGRSPDDGQRAPLPDPEPPDSGGREDWRRAVEAALAEIRAGRLDKVVLARQVTLPAPADAADVAARLRAPRPRATVFALDRAGRCFLGATPERLLSLAGRRFEVDCLAGSAPRGDTPEEDAALAARLLASGKDRAEHEWVVRAVRAGLAPLSARLEVPGEPAVLKLPHVQHLHTPVRGELLPGAGALDLAARLHPTPAVAGAPREAALAFLRRHEPFDRGWYAGVVGWVGAADAELAVAIRCGLLAGGRAHLYAGCGIVAGSDPERELAETGWKLRTLAGALAGDEGPGAAPGAPARPPRAAALPAGGRPEAR